LERRGKGRRGCLGCQGIGEKDPKDSKDEEPRPCCPFGPCSPLCPCSSYDVRLTYRSHSHRRESSCRPSASSEGRSVGSSGISGRSTSGCSRERSFAS